MQFPSRCQLVAIQRCTIRGQDIMAQLAKGVFGALAVMVTFGAIQFASGRDLSSSLPDRFQKPLQNRLQNSLGMPGAAVNRAAKADRAVRAAEAQLPTKTIAIRLDALSDTSILVRVPVVARSRPSSPMLMRSGDQKMTVACEPVVSVLTEVAKHLGPGRCVT
jgi:hypothetical protein